MTASSPTDRRDADDLELRSQLYNWLGDRTSKADGDAHDHESLRALSADLAERFAALKPAPGTDTPDQAVQRDETTNGLHIGDLAGVLHVSQMAPGHWEQYRVNEHTIDWRYVVDGPTAVAGPQRDHDEEGGQPPSGFPGGPDRQMWKFR